MNLDAAESVNFLLGKVAGRFIEDDTFGEVGINGPHKLWAEVGDDWVEFDIDASHYELVEICTAIAAFHDTDVSKMRPILSTTLPDGKRIQIVMPPAAGEISITVRKPCDGVIQLNDYPARFFQSDKSGDVRGKLIDAVSSGQTILVAGQTGSGKTTLMNSLANLIPKSERIVTIEDTPELTFTHGNVVNLFYGINGLTATDSLKSCMRMKPDRILLGEIRDAAAMDLINVLISGHGGSLSSIHAKNCRLAMKRLVLLAMQSKAGQALPFSEVAELAKEVVQVVVHVINDRDGRRITELVYTEGMA